MIRRVFAVALLVSGLAALGCGRGELTAGRAATLLRGSADFTTRPDSPVHRELVEVIFVRAIGRASTEVEFRWRNVPPGSAATSDDVRTSMALFRRTEEGWVLTSLFKVD